MVDVTRSKLSFSMKIARSRTVPKEIPGSPGSVFLNLKCKSHSQALCLIDSGNDLIWTQLVTDKSIPLQNFGSKKAGHEDRQFRKFFRVL